MASQFAKDNGRVPLEAMIELPLRLVAWLMSRVRVNRVQRRDHNGVPGVVKQRRGGASVVILLGNGFLALARSGVRMFVRPARFREDSALYPNGLPSAP